VQLSSAEQIQQRDAKSFTSLDSASELGPNGKTTSFQEIHNLERSKRKLQAHSWRLQQAIKQSKKSLAQLQKQNLDLNKLQSQYGQLKQLLKARFGALAQAKQKLQQELVTLNQPTLMNINVQQVLTRIRKVKKLQTSLGYDLKVPAAKKKVMSGLNSELKFWKRVLRLAKAVLAAKRKVDAIKHKHKRTQDALTNAKNPAARIAHLKKQLLKLQQELQNVRGRVNKIESQIQDVKAGKRISRPKKQKTGLKKSTKKGKKRNLKTAKTKKLTKRGKKTFKKKFHKKGKSSKLKKK